MFVSHVEIQVVVSFRNGGMLERSCRRGSVRLQAAEGPLSLVLAHPQALTPLLENCFTK